MVYFTILYIPMVEEWFRELPSFPTEKLGYENLMLGVYSYDCTVVAIGIIMQCTQWCLGLCKTHQLNLYLVIWLAQALWASGRSVDEQWESIENHLTKMLKEFVMSKFTRRRTDQPWLSGDLKRRCRKKQRLYNRWKKLKSRKKKPCKGAREAYKCCQHDTNNLLKKSQNQYINNILFEGLENKSPKSFCYYIKTQRTESSGVTPPQGEGSNTFWSWEKSEHFGKPVSLCVHSGWPWSCWYTPSRSELSTHAWCYHNRDRSEQAAKGHWSRQSFWLRPDSM